VINNPKRRPPSPTDITLLAKALQDNGVEYVMIGGAAMALHGFPRMTRDIDLFLPVDPKNNRRLLKALRAVPNSEAALKELRLKYLDQGYSTAFEGDIAIDLLYVAADKTYGDLRSHIKHIELDGVPVSTLDIDGMLISKQTTRESDVPDRIKLERLRNALFDAERKRRLDALPGLSEHESAAVRFFSESANSATRAGAAVNWKQLEDQVLDAGRKKGTLNMDELAEALCQFSPGAVYASRQIQIREQAKGSKTRRAAR
jgi:predicted nucleotidyltransferase